MSLNSSKSTATCTSNMLAEIYRSEDRFDIVHSHLDVWTLPFAPSVIVHPTRLDDARSAGRRHRQGGSCLLTPLGAPGVDQR